MLRFCSKGFVSPLHLKGLQSWGIVSVKHWLCHTHLVRCVGHFMNRTSGTITFSSLFFTRPIWCDYLFCPPLQFGRLAMDAFSQIILLIALVSFFTFQWLFHSVSPWISSRVSPGFLRLNPKQKIEWNSRYCLLIIMSSCSHLLDRETGFLSSRSTLGSDCFVKKGLSGKFYYFTTQGWSEGAINDMGQFNSKRERTRCTRGQNCLMGYVKDLTGNSLSFEIKGIEKGLTSPRLLL